MDKLVSIISPTYNGSKYLPHFFDGVLHQTYKKIELILIDDGSIDDTCRVISEYKEKFKDCGIEFIVIHQENKGQAAAINAGLKVFVGEYLMWVDSDDYLLPENVAEKVLFLQKHPECGFVQCLAETVDASKGYEVIGKCGRKEPKGKDTLFEDLIYERNVLFGPGIIMCRADALRTAIPSLHIYEGREGQNYQLMLPLAYTCKCGYLGKILLQIVAHSDSHSRKERSVASWLDMYVESIKILDATISRITQMPENEKQFWYDNIRKKYIKRNYLLIGRYFSELKMDMRKLKIRLSFSERIRISLLFQILKKIAIKIKCTLHNVI